MTTSIYAIVDTTGEDVFYIGKTSVGIETRFKQHLDFSKDPKSAGHPLANKLRTTIGPRVILIETLSNDEWQAAERYWIACFKELGYDLTNQTRGGNGFSKHSAATKIKIGKAFIGRKHSEVSKKKMSDRAIAQWSVPDAPIRTAVIGPRRPEFYKLVSDKLKAAWQRDDYRAKRIALELTPEMREKRAAASRARWDRQRARTDV